MCTLNIRVQGVYPVRQKERISWKQLGKSWNSIYKAIFVAEVMYEDHVLAEGLAQLDISVYGLWREKQNKFIEMLCLAGQMHILRYSLLKRMERVARTTAINLMDGDDKLSVKRVMGLYTL